MIHYARPDVAFIEQQMQPRVCHKQKIRVSYVEKHSWVEMVVAAGVILLPGKRHNDGNHSDD